MCTFHFYISVLPIMTQNSSMGVGLRTPLILHKTTYYS